MGLTIEEDIGQMAGAVWYALNTHGELSLAQLKKMVEGKGPIFDWAIGWLAREGKVVLTPPLLTVWAGGSPAGHNRYASSHRRYLRDKGYGSCPAMSPA